MNFEIACLAVMKIFGNKGTIGLKNIQLNNDITT